ncbi:MAG: hypothetical protein ACK4YD_10690 [Chitinophagia bacterium]|jgi:hypothetical protein
MTISKSAERNIVGILIGVLFVLGLFDILYTFAGFHAQYGLLYPAAHMLLNVLLFVSISFIWSKEKWALFLFLGILICHFGLDIYVGAFQLWKLLLLLPGWLFYRWTNS